ncbi:MAG: aminopeptidase [Labilithrix sp.]|nr:aminopeptidase [Labilithrix sp.]
MYPSFRGENDNPGQFEMFYGEVDDLLSAVEYVRQLPWVDPARVYLAGHSSGATLVLLAATASENFRAAFAFGPWIGIDDDPAALRAMRIMNRVHVPFDPDRPDEARVRSSFQFAGSIHRPTFAMEGEEYALPAMPLFVERAQRARAPFSAFTVKGGDHFNILHTLTRLVASRILEDTGPTCSIRIAAQDLNEAFARRPVQPNRSQSTSK